MRYIDSHCHLHDEKFAPDLEAVLERAMNANITHMVSIGCDIATSLGARDLAKKIDAIYFSAGFHPHEAKHLDDAAFAELKRIALEKKCVGIGECGLDYYYLHSSKEEQKKAFSRQAALAGELGLPLIIHLRDAFDDCLSILKEHLGSVKKVLIHCFSGSQEEAAVFADLGCYLSLSGIVTFKKPGDLSLVAKTFPLDRLLAETDAPYLAPHPLRGKRNEPAYIAYTVSAIALARGEDLATLSEHLYQNSKTFFGF